MENTRNYECRNFSWTYYRHCDCIQSSKICTQLARYLIREWLTSFDICPIRSLYLTLVTYFSEFMFTTNVSWLSHFHIYVISISTSIICSVVTPSSSSKCSNSSVSHCMPGGCYRIFTNSIPSSVFEFLVPISRMKSVATVERSECRLGEFIWSCCWLSGRVGKEFSISETRSDRSTVYIYIYIYIYFRTCIISD